MSWGHERNRRTSPNTVYWQTTLTKKIPWTNVPKDTVTVLHKETTGSATIYEQVLIEGPRPRQRSSAEEEEEEEDYPLGKGNYFSGPGTTKNSSIDELAR